MAAAPDRGSGSILAVAVIGGVLSTVVLSVPLYIGLSIEQSLRGAADAAALGAADVASGIAPGIPCTVAAEVATANSAALSTCQVDGRVVSVRVKRAFLGFSMSADATAGPPVVGTN